MPLALPARPLARPSVGSSFPPFGPNSDNPHWQPLTLAGRLNREFVNGCVSLTVVLDGLSNHPLFPCLVYVSFDQCLSSAGNTAWDSKYLVFELKDLTVIESGSSSFS